MIRYAITDRTLYASAEKARQGALLYQAAQLASEGIDYIQLREKDLDASALLRLTREMKYVVQGTPTQIVLNGPRDLAEAAGVGWHRSDATDPQRGAISTSVHTLDGVEAQRHNASLLLFAPIFGKTVHGQTIQPGLGLDALRDAVNRAQGTPVLALGGITEANSELCIQAGASGIAAIRMFLRTSRGLF